MSTSLRALHASRPARVPANSSVDNQHIGRLFFLRKAVAAQTASGGEKVQWVNESISNYPFVWTHLRPEQPGSVIASGGTSLGYGLGASIGAYLGGIVAKKEHDLVAYVVGDGTFLFGLPASAFWIARRYNTVRTAVDERVQWLMRTYYSHSLP